MPLFLPVGARALLTRAHNTDVTVNRAHCPVNSVGDIGSAPLRGNTPKHFSAHDTHWNSSNAAAGTLHMQCTRPNEQRIAALQ